MKTDPGRYFEDFTLGETIAHATPRTLGEGDRALYQALYGSRFALQSSAAFARAVGLPGQPMDDLVAFHAVFGKTVPDISLNALANLGYAEGRFRRRLYGGETVSATSEVIGLKQVSSGKAGIVWVRTTGRDAEGTEVLSYVRWVLVRKRDTESPAPEPTVPDLAPVVAAQDLIVPDGLDPAGWDRDLSGSPHLFEDYAPGELIDHVDGQTLEDAEHMMATRLWQNTAKVHFDATARDGQPRLIYGGHIISLARALSFNGLGNACLIAAINGGIHAAPSVAGDTIRAFTEVIETAPTSHPGIGALRLRLVAVKNRPPGDLRVEGEEGKRLPDVVLDFDHWALIPMRG